jgi:hypothetical protein
MPKFIRTVLASAIVSWIIVVALIIKSTPDSYFNIGVFLIAVFIALYSSLCIPFYLVYRKRLVRFTDQRVLFKMSSKWPAFISFIAVGILFLKAFHLINLLNTGLFTLLCIGIFFQIKGRK